MTRRNFIKSIGLALSAAHLHGCSKTLSALGERAGLAAGTKKPNVVFILTDDQGYGDLACNGNPWIKTPNMDALREQSVCMTNYHVSPLCSPSRASLMTGRHCRHVGVQGTNNCTNFMSIDVPTMADLFAADGYRTGLFGKWHLGDHYPYRPQDRGFQEAIYFGDGAITTVGDIDWRNDYFDDVYSHNGVKQKYEGYCTDVWFREAMRFIEANQREPFLCYLSVNAPHAPYLVDGKYSEPYEKYAEHILEPKFYGMITNIDENLGKLMAFLRDSDLEENTIVIFMTDNGSVGNSFTMEDPEDPGYRPLAGVPSAAPHPAELAQGYNAGMRGQKASPYDGGHRVPFFVRWPSGHLDGGRQMGQLCAHIDVLPTLIALAGINPPADTVFDGVSLQALLEGNSGAYPDRTIIESFSGVAMTQQWRLVHNDRLYDMQADPSQLNNVAAQYPDVVAKLQAELAQCKKKDDHTQRRMIIGADQENPITLCPEQWLSDESEKKSAPLFSRTLVLNGELVNGHFLVAAACDGIYDFSIMRWPEELNTPITGAPPNGNALAITEARLKVNDLDVRQDIQDGMRSADFSLPLKAGGLKIETWLIRNDGSSSGAYYLRIKRR